MTQTFRYFVLEMKSLWLMKLNNCKENKARVVSLNWLIRLKDRKSEGLSMFPALLILISITAIFKIQIFLFFFTQIFFMQVVCNSLMNILHVCFSYLFIFHTEIS